MICHSTFWTCIQLIRTHKKQVGDQNRDISEEERVTRKFKGLLIRRVGNSFIEVVVAVVSGANAYVDDDEMKVSNMKKDDYIEGEANVMIKPVLVHLLVSVFIG